MMTSSVCAAEKEASEVLHSLLSVERVVTKHHGVNQNIVTTSTPQQQPQTEHEHEHGQLQWQGNIISSHSLFGDHFPQTIDEQQVHDVSYN